MGELPYACKRALHELVTNSDYYGHESLITERAVEDTGEILDIITEDLFELMDIARAQDDLGLAGHETGFVRDSIQEGSALAVHQQEMLTWRATGGTETGPENLVTDDIVRARALRANPERLFAFDTIMRIHTLAIMARDESGFRLEDRRVARDVLLYYLSALLPEFDERVERLHPGGWEPSGEGAKLTAAPLSRQEIVATDQGLVRKTRLMKAELHHSIVVKFAEDILDFCERGKRGQYKLPDPTPDGLEALLQRTSVSMAGLKTKPVFTRDEIRDHICRKKYGKAFKSLINDRTGERGRR